MDKSAKFCTWFTNHALINIRGSHQKNFSAFTKKQNGCQ